MNCRTCDYPLWNLKARQCPECGAAFKPSEFEFVANSVRFCCPQCDQTYYGTGAKGHLVPAEFSCVSCGLRMAMDDAVLRPAEGVQEDQTRVHRAPWLERRERGFVRAFFSTIGMALVNQSGLVRGLPAAPATGSAWWFAVVITIVVFGMVIIPFTLLIALPIALSGGGRGGVSQGLGAFSMFAATMIVASLFILLLWALVTHGLLAITGPKKAGLGRTMEVFGYSAGANVFSAIPCVGIYFGWIWWVISATLLIKEAHGISGGRAALVTLPLPLACVAAVVIMFMVVIAQTSRVTGTTGPFGTVNTLPGQNSANPQVFEAAQVTNALNSFQGQWGAMPRHALELVANHDLMASDFIAVDSNTSTVDIPAGTTTLAAFERLSVVARQQAVREAAASLPSGIVAHRFGDFVFTHHGFSVGADGGLWLVVMCVDPKTNPQSVAADVVVGQVDGTMVEIPGDRVMMMLNAQNQRRADFGLPPLPDPRTVTHQEPAVAEGLPKN